MSSNVEQWEMTWLVTVGSSLLKQELFHNQAQHLQIRNPDPESESCWVRFHNHDHWLKEEMVLFWLMFHSLALVWVELFHNQHWHCLKIKISFIQANQKIPSANFVRLTYEVKKLIEKLLSRVSKIKR